MAPGYHFVTPVFFEQTAAARLRAAVRGEQRFAVGSITSQAHRRATRAGASVSLRQRDADASHGASRDHVSKSEDLENYLRALIRATVLVVCWLSLTAPAAFAANGDVKFRTFAANELPTLRGSGLVISTGPPGSCGREAIEHSIVFGASGKPLGRFDAGAGCAGEGGPLRGGGSYSFNGPFSGDWGTWIRFPSPVSVTLDGSVAVPGSPASATIELHGPDGVLIRTLATPLIETGDGDTLSRIESTVRGAVVSPLASGGYISVARSITFRSDAQGNLVSGWGTNGYLAFGDAVGGSSAVAVLPDGTLAHVVGSSVEWFDGNGQKDVARTAATTAALRPGFRVTSVAAPPGFDGLFVFGFRRSEVPVVGAKSFAGAVAMHVRADGSVDANFGDMAGELKFPSGVWTTFLSADRKVDGRPSVAVDSQGRAVVSFRYVVDGDESLVLTRLMANGRRDLSYGRQRWNRSSLRGALVLPIQIGAAAGMPVPPLNEISQFDGTTQVLTRRNTADCAGDRVKSRDLVQSHMSWLVDANGDEPVLSRAVLVAIPNVGADTKRSWVGLDHTRMYGPRADSVVGTAGCDEVSLGSGNDRLAAAGGPDLVEGGSGDDTIDGGPGSDELYGAFRFQPVTASGRRAFATGPGRDTLHGGAGNDYLGGVSGPAHLYGDSGNDQLEGIAPRLIMSGGSGNDNLIGGGAGALLDGGNGRDVISGTAKSERILGGAGNDLIIGDEEAYDAYALPGTYRSGVDRVDCGPGRDVAYITKGTATLNCETVHRIF